jgi:hypothetical protein
MPTPWRQAKLYHSFGNMMYYLDNLMPTPWRQAKLYHSFGNMMYYLDNLMPTPWRQSKLYRSFGNMMYYLDKQSCISILSISAVAWVVNTEGILQKTKL